MKVSLNGAKLGVDKLSFAEFIELAAQHGYDGVDFSVSAAMRAAEERGGLEALAALFAEKKVAPAVFGLEVEWRKDDAAFQQGMQTLEDKAKFASALGCSRCCTWMLPAVNGDPAAWRAQTAERFKAIASVFEQHGIRFGLEWVGPHHLRAGGVNATGETNVIYTMPQTLELIAEIGKPNIGLLVDSYHCYTTGVTEAELAALNDDQIVHVHINDAPKGVGPGGARDGERVLPGEGEIDLAAFLRGLKAANYSGYIATEVLSPNLIADTPNAAAAKVRDSLKALGI
ncbi:MAG: hypothetical protein OHK0029_28690 [Armatimonadaceae bacterium]